MCTVIRQLILINAPMIIAKYIQFTTNHPSLNNILMFNNFPAPRRQRISCPMNHKTL